MGNEASMFDCVDTENASAVNRQKRRYRGTVNLPQELGKFVTDRESTHERCNILDFTPNAREIILRSADGENMPEDIKIVINDLFLTTFPFSMLDADSREQILSTMTKQDAVKGEEIVGQGQLHKFCYIVVDGTFEEVKGGTTRHFCRPQDVQPGKGSSCFGQMNLIHRVLRSKSVITCTSDDGGKLWKLKNDIYVQILSQVAKVAGAKRKKIMSKVDFFKKCNLTDEQVAHLSVAVDRVKYGQGKAIIKKGDPGSEFYCVIKGRAEATEAGDTNGTHTYGPGDCFGEQALMNDDGLRQANVTAKTKCELFVLHRDDFANLLGPYKSVMKEHHLRTVLIQMLRKLDTPEIKKVKNMGDQQLRRLCQRFELKTYRHHDIIVSLEDNKNVSDDFYVVYKGSALMKYGDELIETKSVGNCFGNAALMIDKIPNKEHEYVAQEGDEGMLCFHITQKSFVDLLQEISTDEESFLNSFGNLNAIEREQERLKDDNGGSQESFLPWCAGGRTDDDDDDASLGRTSGDAIMRETHDGDSFERNFDLQKQIGRGMLGQVFLVQHKRSKEHFAMKTMSKCLVAETHQQACVNLELRFLKSINHPFILQTRAYFQDNYCLFLILDLLPGGELFRLGEKRFPSLPLDQVRFYIASIVDALGHMHDNNIIYRDLKPENVLVDQAGWVKLVDFGFAKILKPGQRTYTFLGTPDYMAPEIIRRMGYGHPADFWAAGVFLYEKINGYSMFSDKGKDKDQISLFKKIVTWKLPKKQRLVEHLKDEYADAADLILQLTKVREAERLGSGRGAQAIKQHPFFKDVDFVALRLRKYQPESAIWVPDFDKKDPTKHFRKKLRYTPPKEYTGDETWCAHW
jgi:serine/threonine protein kinase/CRP-like cAMP-binding protein